MNELWYYVLNGQRNGPVPKEEILKYMEDGVLKGEDYVWRKTLRNWVKIKDLDELKPVVSTSKEQSIPKIDSLNQFRPDEKLIFIKIGEDRGSAPTEYGPFSIQMIKKLFREKRINGKTLIFSKGLASWKALGEFSDYQEIFDEMPPVIEPNDRRRGNRKPFVARMFIHNDKEVFEGICRDISVGGMQVLVKDFRGKAGQKLSFNVHPDNSEFHFVASGNVVRVLEGNQGFSFRFVDLSSEAKIAIERYLKEAQES